MSARRPDPRSPEAERDREWSRAQRLALCEVLGLDPERTTSVNVQFFPNGGTMIRWEGLQRLDAAETCTALAAIATVQVAKP